MPIGQHVLLDEAAEDAANAKSAAPKLNHATVAESQPIHALATRSQNALFVK